MANICDNTFFAYSECEENLKHIYEFIGEHFDSDLEYYDGTNVEGYFTSRWVFPEEHMKDMFESMPNKEDIYMRCLSVEYGCLYHALWVCDGEDGWSEV